MINVFQPALGKEELMAISRVFESNWVGKGNITDQFESAFAKHVFVDRKLIRSINCCTEGLFQSMILLNIGKGDEVILPTISFVAAANAIVSCGARPVFCDIDPRTLNATASTIEEKITSRTKAVIILHYGGLPCELDEIVNIIRINNISLIEDSACGVASLYKGKACGTFGDIGLWSFDAMKIIVCGDGGMIYCKDLENAELLEKSIYLGLVTKSGLSTRADTKWWEFEISCSGRRAIMNDISSSIGLEQIKKLPQFIKRRKEIKEIYDNELGSISWLNIPPPIPEYSKSSYFLYWIQMHHEKRDKLASYLRNKSIYTTFRYYPLHMVKYYNVKECLLQAENVAKTTLCIPIHNSLTDNDVEMIIQAIKNFKE